MEDITQRQTEILKVIIKEYTDTGEPVGSEILEKKYKLGVSPATIRNEMVLLAKNGYIKKAHFSSGRVPSAKGFRFYINKIMKEKEMSTADEVAYKNSVWDERGERHKLLAQATKVLAHRTGLVSVAATNSGDMYYSGVSNLLSIHEFIDREIEKYLFDRLDEVSYWERILERMEKVEGEIYYLLGDDDLRDPMYESCASVFCEFEADKVKGIIGVVGPKRMNYDTVSPQLKFFSSLLQDIIKTQNL